MSSPPRAASSWPAAEGAFDPFCYPTGPMRGLHPAAAWWLAAAAYTAALPGAILAWRWLEGALGRSAAGAVPTILFLLLAALALARPGTRTWRRAAAALVLGGLGLAWAPSAPKGVHVPLYMGLAWLLARAFRSSGLGGHPAPWVAATGILLGITEELLQGWVPSRYYAWGDMGVNALGVLAGTVLLPAGHATPPRSPQAGPAAAWALVQAGCLTLLAGWLQWRWHQAGNTGLTLGWPWAAGLLAWLMVSATAFESTLGQADWPWRAVFYASAAGLLICAAGAGLGAGFR